VDGGDPKETVRVKHLVGYVDGQATNPSLIAKNPEVRTLVSSGRKFSSQQSLATKSVIAWKCYSGGEHSKCFRTIRKELTEQDDLKP
jgi:hypothetical protein